MTHTYIFDFESNNYIVMVRDAQGNSVSVNPDAVPENEEPYSLPAQMDRVYKNPQFQHFGLKMTIENFELDAWKGAIDVKCWDSTGKDLGVTAKTNYNTVGFSSLEAPAEDSVLTTFSDDDALLFDRSAHMCEGKLSDTYRSSTFSGNSSLISANFDDASGRGASDGVLRYEWTGGIAAGSVYFGGGPDKAALGAGGTLKLRLYVSAPETAKLRLSLLPFTNTAVSFENGAPFVDLITPEGTGVAEAARSAGKFVDVSFSAEQLAKLTDGQDTFKGFTIFSQRLDSGAEAAAAYFDKVMYSKPADLSFCSENGATLASENVSTGSTLKELGISFPEASGIGWTRTQNGTDFFTENSVIDGNLILYAKAGREGSYAALAGVYYHETSGGYFELKEDKSVASGFAGFAYASYLFCDDGYVVFGDGTYAGVNASGSILLGGREYKKATKTHRLSFYADGEPVGETSVPENAAGYAIANPRKPYYTFVGWMLDGEAYDFSVAVRGDLRLDAEYRFNHVEDYAPYLKGYYDRATGTLINLKAEGKATVVIGGKKEQTDYRISDDGTLLLDDEKYVVNEYSLVGENTFLFLRADYKVVFDMNGGGEEKTVTATSENDYLIAEPEAPQRTGYTFRGWKTAKGEKFDFSVPITSSATLFADWEYVQGEMPEESGCSSSVSGAAALSGMIAAIAAAAKKRRKSK